MSETSHTHTVKVCAENVSLFPWLVLSLFHSEVFDVDI